MRYLGEEIITDEYFEFHTSAVTCGAYLGSDDIKKDIRKKVLPTYQPTKTLEWLEKVTGSKWEFIMGTILTNGIHVYNLESNKFVTEMNIVESLTPREFIEKISRGEWA